MRSAMARWMVLGGILLTGVWAAFGQTVTFPVEEIQGPVCVLHDTARGVAFTMSPVHSQYNVIVTDGLAQIRLTQMFVNEYGGIRDIVYVFPLPHDGAVHAMAMVYHDSAYVARIYEKEEAQQIYDSVASSGGAAALLLQSRPNVFQQHLANIALGDTAWVRIEVSVPLKYNAGEYELSIPTMIGCRFPSAGADPVPGCSGWNPPADRDGSSLEFNVLVQTGYPVTGLESPTHALSVSAVEAVRPVLEQRMLLLPGDELPMAHNRAALLAAADSYPNRDFVLRFRRDNTACDFSMATCFDPDHPLGHFALNLFPDTTLFAGNRPNLEIVLLVDISGSQSGWPLQKEKEICGSILDRLLATDRLCVLAFSDNVYWCFGNQSAVDATAGNIATARTWIGNLSVIGGTQLLAGIQAALATPTTSEHQRYYVFLTDGFITNEEAIYSELRNHPSHPTVFTFGAGNNLNRYFLEQTAGKGINVYTHGEMLPAHGYPELKRFAHLAGNYGGAWQDQRAEFDAFPGAILMTTNCIQKPKDAYKARLFTCGLVAWPGVQHIADHDFTPVIEAALAAPGFAETQPEKTILTGFGHHAVLGVADKVVDAVKAGAIKHFFLIGGCDGAKPGRNYYTDFAHAVPDDSVILTLACGKYRFNKDAYGDIGGIPRLLDVGQCNDAYSAIKIAGALAGAFGVGVNDLPLSMILSWYEQKAVCILLTLLHLGLQNMQLGPSLPAFVTPNVLTVLVETFAIAPIGDVQEDLQACLAR